MCCMTRSHIYHICTYDIHMIYMSHDQMIYIYIYNILYHKSHMHDSKLEQRLTRMSAVHIDDSL